MLKDIIYEKWKECFKSGDKVGKSAFESIKAKILLAEKSGEYELPLTDIVVENIIVKDIKELQESKSYYPVDGEEYYWIEYKINLLNEYLPKQLTEDEVISIIRDKISMESNMGKLIGLVVKEVGNKFDKSKIANLVKTTIGK